MSERLRERQASSTIAAPTPAALEERGRGSSQVVERDPRIVDAGTIIELPENLFPNWLEIRQRARNDFADQLNKNRTPDQIREKQAFTDFVQNIVKGNHQLSVSEHMLGKLSSHLFNDLFGMGIIGLFLAVPEVEDIFLDRWDRLDVVINGEKLWVQPTGFLDDEEVRNWLQTKVFNPINKTLTRANPSENAILEDGSRVLALIDPISPNTAFSIRRHKKEIFKTVNAYYETKIAPSDFFQDLNVWVKTYRNLVNSGATGSGKTTLINVAGSLIPDSERIITLEDTPELQIDHIRVLPLHTYEKGARAGAQDETAIGMSDLLRYSLRAKPDRIIVGEVRDKETLDMLDALNTGHAGSMTTLHSNSPVDAITRIQMMCARHPARANISHDVLLDLISSVVDIIIQIRNIPGVGRRVIAAEQVLFAKHYINQPQVLTGEGITQLHKNMYLRPLWRWSPSGLIRVAEFAAPDHDLLPTEQSPVLPVAHQALRS